MATRVRADPEYLSEEAFNALLAQDGSPEAPQRAPANPNAPARQDRDVVRRPDGSSYTVLNRSFTNKTPTELLNEGYELDPATGSWFQTLPGSINTEDYGFRVLTDQELEARRVAEEQGVAKQAALESVRQASDQALFGGSNQGAYLRGAVEQAPFLDEALAGGTALATGQSYDQVRDFQRGMAQTDRENNGTARNVGGVAGALAGFAAPGSRFIGGAASGVGQSLRAAGVGSAYGAAYGGGAADDSYASRLQGAVGGAVGGAVAGGAIQGGLNYAQRLASITSINRPPPISGTPEQMAASRIVRTMEPGALSERTRLNDLGLSPSVMDVTGGTTERLVRTAAAPAGTGSNLAVENATGRAANLKPEILSDVRGLSPIDDTAEGLASSLTSRRSNLARDEYPGPYSQPITIPDDVRALLSDDSGRSSIRMARADAAEIPDNAAQVSELDALLNADLRSGPLPQVSAGTVDAIVQATRTRASRFQERGLNRRAAGAYQRREIIDNSLDNVEGLEDARGTYRGLSQQIDALEPRNALNIFEDPRDFARRLEGMSPEARDAALVRVRQDLSDVIGGQRNAGTGSIDTVTQAQYSRQNLAALLGEERANQLLSSISSRVQQAQRAARVSPNTGSQTQLRGMDEGTLGAAEALGAVTDAGRGLVGDTPAIARTIDRVLTSIRSRSMSPEVREQIVRFGIGSADDLERIVMLADEARAAGRPVPRAVRSFIESSRQTIGPQFATSLESALLPMRAAAEEEQGPQ